MVPRGLLWFAGALAAARIDCGTASSQAVGWGSCNMAAVLASPRKTPRQSDPRPDWQGLARQGPPLLSGNMAAVATVLHEGESRREMTPREREARWACEWWPPD